MNQLQSCGNCNKEASFLCSRCQFEYYCCKSCQVSDFPRHRTHCFILPALASINEKNEVLYQNEHNISLLDNDKQISNDFVKDTLPRVMYEQTKLSIPNQTKKHLVKNHEEGNNDYNPTANKVIKDDQNQNKKQLQGKDKIAFDHVIHTPPSNMYNNSSKILHLDKNENKNVDISSESFSSKTLQKNVSDQEVADSVINVQAFHRSKQTMLIDRPLIKQEDNRTFIHDVSHRLLKNEKTKVTLMNGSQKDNIFYVIEMIEGINDYFEHIEDNIFDFLKTDKHISYKPVKNEMVLAKFEDEFYRAVCKGLNEGNPTTYQIFFVDYGNMVTDVKEEDIKPLGPKLKNEIILHQIEISNMPKNLSKHQANVIENPEGFYIEVLQKNPTTGVYSVRVCDI